MPDLQDGQRVTVQGSGVNQYVLARDRAVYSCTCPAWRNMRLPISERRCKHLIAYLGNTPLASVTPRVQQQQRQQQQLQPTTVPSIATTTYDEPEPLRSTREAALTNAIDMHVVLFDKMEEIYGLRLPREISYAAGFYLGLRDDEKAELADCVTRGLRGIGAWFLPGGLDWAGGADQRLRDRAEDDPPEVVPVMSGCDGDERFALLYDEPSELPAGIIRRHDKRTVLGRATLLETLRDRLAQAMAIHPALMDPPSAKSSERRLAILSWLDEVWRRKTAEVDEESSMAFQSMGWSRGSFTLPYVPGWSVPDDLAGSREYNERHAAYSSGSSPRVDEWIGRAMTELTEGSPGRALFLGRELHMAGGDAFRAKASELLIRAYAVLGRGAFLEIVRVQHLDLHPSIPLYELPPPHHIVTAAAADDAEGIARAWSQSQPTESDVEEAFKRAASVEVFDAIFDLVDVEARDRASRVALGRRLTQMLRLPPRSPERAALALLIGRFVERSSIDARAFERTLEAHDNELTKKAAHSVDLASRSQGETPLHIAARAALPDVVRILIDRGIDVRTTNQKRRMAFDHAVQASSHSPRDAHEVLLMLEAAGGALGKVPTLVFEEAAPIWTAGDNVHHVKFGDGTVERVEGTGIDAKLHIRFGAIGKGRGKVKGDVKVLVGKFVERR